MHAALLLTMLVAVLAGPWTVAGVGRHSLVTTSAGDMHELRPLSHDVDIDVLGFVAEVSVRECYAVDETTEGRALLAFAGSEQCELLECVLLVDGAPGSPARVSDSAGLTLVYGPPVTQGSTVSVVLRYARLLPRTDGWYELRHDVPQLAGPPEGTEDSGTAAWLAVSITGGMPICGLTTPSHDSEIWYNGTRQARVVPDLGKRGGETFLLRYSLAGEEIVDEYFEFETPDGDVIHMVVEPRKR